MGEYLVVMLLQFGADGCFGIPLKTILWQGSCCMGQRLCSAASIYNRWALKQFWKSPGILTKKKQTLSSPSISHPGTVFIWITPPNPLSNDMSQWITIPLVLLRGKHYVFWQRTTQMQQKGEFQMDSRGTEYWSDYNILDLHIFREWMGLFENYHDTLTAEAVFQQ